MKLALKILLGLLLTALLGGAGTLSWYLLSKQPERDGTLALERLSAPVKVRYDERGVPHISAANEADLYRALGYVHAQDRLFQMEMVRRLARGELAEVLGPKLVKVDKLFRTLGLRSHAEQVVQALDKNSPAVQAQLAYLDGVNQYVANGPAPLEFDLIGIPKRPFTLQDTVAVSGYLAYSFAAAFKTEPVLTYIRDELGEDYLRIFELDWNPEGVLLPPKTARAAPSPGSPTQLAQTVPHRRTKTAGLNWATLSQLALVSQQAQSVAGLPLLEGSNAWAVSGARTESGSPILAGDPHIGFSLPAVWFEAHLQAPGFELYGHFQALNASALLGHNMRFGWSLTMFQNDDLDLIAEKVNPANHNQVWFDGRWVNMESSEESIAVKGGEPVKLVRQFSPHGPVISNAFDGTLGQSPVSMWWAWLETENPILDAFYELNRADTLAKARQAASKISAPGLNIVWANADGDIGWWAAAKLPIRPLTVNPSFILQGGTEEADKLGFYRFEDNPHEENPPRGYILSANQQPLSPSGVPVPGYYNLYDRAQALEDRLGDDKIRWNVLNTEALQLSTQTGYYWRVLGRLLPALSEVVKDPMERSVFDSLSLWDGQYTVNNIPPTVFTEFCYQLVKAAMADELGDAQFQNLLGTRALDFAIPRLANDPDSPWWDDVRTPKVETRRDILRKAWRATMTHLKDTLGDSPTNWAWGAAHTLTHAHPMAAQPPFGWLFNVGPFEVPGGREVPNNMATPVGPAPWNVVYGPSTRRVIDFADANLAQGINPVGQSGVWLNTYHHDQAAAYAAGGYLPMHLSEKDVTGNTLGTLALKPPAAAEGAVKP
jgi:penicillin amidase